jgi:hypothetical protein
MNEEEQQQKAYLEVIDALLNCPQGKETAVYQKFSHLVDPILVAMMEAEANELENQFAINTNWLRQEAARIGPPMQEWQQLNQQVVELYGRGDIPGAIPYAEQALALAKQIFISPNNDLAASLNNLAGLYAATNRYSEALNLFIEAIQVENSVLADYFTYANPENQLILLEQMHSNLEVFVSFVWRYLQDDRQAVEAAFNAILQRKAASTIASTILNRAQYSDRYPQLRPQFDRWQDLKTQIALQGEHLDPASLKSLQQECERIREQLARQVPEIRAESLNIDRQVVALYLPSNAQLVEFFRFDVLNFQENKWDAPRYIAFSLGKDTDAPLKLIDLGEAAPIDELVQNYRRVATTNTSGNMALDDEDKIAPPPESQAEIAAGFELHNAIMEPILQRVGNTTQSLILAADGDLYRVPFATLPLNPEGKRLIDTYQIETLTAARDLRRRFKRSDRPATSPLIVADPDYDYGSPIPPAELTRSTQQCSSTLGGTFDRLAVTRQLACQIGEKLGIIPYLDDRAAETLFHQITSPRYLVVATHGFATDAYYRRQYAAIEELKRCPIELEGKILQEYQDVIDSAFREYWQQILTHLQTENSHLVEWCQHLLEQIDDTNNPGLTSPPAPLLQGEAGWFHERRAKIS